jgi:ketosteroid isomerase-like protein
METIEGSDLALVLQYRHAAVDPAVTERNRQQVLAALDAVAAGDMDTFWSMFDDEVVFHEAACLPYGGSHRGLEAAKKAFLHMSDTFSNNHVVFEAVAAAEEIVTAYQTINFEVKRNGATGQLPVAEIFRFRDGKVIEWRACYFDSNMVAEAIARARL